MPRIPDYLGIADRVILVTGATSGIGRAVAIAASSYGARVVLVARRGAELNTVLESLKGPGHLVAPYDLLDFEGLPAFLDSVVSQVGPIDCVVHAAGVHATMPLKSTTAARVSEMLEMNITTAVMLAKAFRHKQVRGKSPSLVLLSSAVGIVGQPAVSVYSATKGAISALVRSLALELAREGIRVNCIAPGVVETPLTDALHASIGDAAFDEVVAAHPLGIGSADDVANAALYLASSASGWVTGSTLVVDGGYTAR